MEADEETPEQTRRDSAQGCATTGLVAVGLCVPAPFAALQVVNVATGSDQVNVLPDGAATLLVCLSLPLAFVVTRRASRAQIAALLTAFVVSLGFTLWIMRPQAPDGRAFDVTYETMATELEQDVIDGLEDVAPGRWSPIEGTEWTTPCVDRFGRDRGAVYGGQAYRLEEGFTPDERRQFAASVAAPGRDVQVPALGTPVELLGQDHPHPTVQVENDERYEETIVSVVTPCLKSAEPR